MTILLISGSIRKASYNTMLLTYAQRFFPADTTFQWADISQLPHFNQDLEHEPEHAAVHTLREQILHADGVLIATPEFNHSYSAILKNALEWMSRGPHKAFPRKHVAILGASTSAYGTLRAQLHLREVLRAVGASVLERPEFLLGMAQNKLDANGNLHDEVAEKILGTIVANFVAVISATHS